MLENSAYVYFSWCAHEPTFSHIIKLSNRVIKLVLDREIDSKRNGKSRSLITGLIKIIISHICTWSNVSHLMPFIFIIIALCGS